MIIICYYYYYMFIDLKISFRNPFLFLRHGFSCYPATLPPAHPPARCPLPLPVETTFFPQIPTTQIVNPQNHRRHSGRRRRSVFRAGFRQTSHRSSNTYNPNDVEALRSLIEERFNAKKFEEALNIVESLMELEPNEIKWLVWRGFAYKEMGDSESARKDFETVLRRDPCRFRAYQGLVMLKMKSDDIDSWVAILKRVEGALEIVKELHKGKGNKLLEIRRFKLLIACIKCFNGSYSEAMDDHLELEKEDPLDCFQHFHFGILYLALEKCDEANKQFEICERLAPKLPPNKGYFGDDEDM